MLLQLEFQNEIINWVLVVNVFIDLFAEQFIIPRIFLLWKAFLSKDFDFEKNSEVHEVTVLFVKIVFAFQNREIKKLSLIALVSLKGWNTGTYLLDLEVIRKLPSTDIDSKIFDDFLQILLFLGQ